MTPRRSKESVKAAKKPAGKKARKSPLKQAAHVFYSPELGEKICLLVSEGQTLRAIGKRAGMPHPGTICKWADEYPEFGAMYSAARDAAADLFEADIIEAANNVDNTNHKALRVKIDALKWVAACRRPKRYGARVETENRNLNLNSEPLSVDRLSAFNAVLEKAVGNAP